MALTHAGSSTTSSPLRWEARGLRTIPSTRGSERSAGGLAPFAESGFEGDEPPRGGVEVCRVGEDCRAGPEALRVGERGVGADGRPGEDEAGEFAGTSAGGRDEAAGAGRDNVSCL